jgi:hypothetical protein
VPTGTALLAVPGQVSSGPGWHFDAAAGVVDVTGDGTVLSGLYIPYMVNITGSNVVVRDVRVVSGGFFGIGLAHTSGVTIEDSTVSGRDASGGRVGSAIDDMYGDSTGMVIKNDNVFFFKTAVQVTTGVVTGNYIHDPGYVAGDHTNGVFDVGTTQPLIISGNTILNSLTQTDAISLDASSRGEHIANKTIEGNFLGGGAYTIYGGASLGNVTSNITITNNRFSQAFFTEGGEYGPVASFDRLGVGNTWARNEWASPRQLGDISEEDGQTRVIPPPKPLPRAPCEPGRLPENTCLPNSVMN